MTLNKKPPRSNNIAISLSPHPVASYPTIAMKADIISGMKLATKNNIKYLLGKLTNIANANIKAIEFNINKITGIGY